jgi:hypothetical protein
MTGKPAKPLTHDENKRYYERVPTRDSEAMLKGITPFIIPVFKKYFCKSFSHTRQESRE